MEFACVRDCSQCCTEREYYPSVEFGKIGVLLLPEEKKAVEAIAEETGVSVTILPRIGVSEEGADGPETVIAYQMMGRDDNGNTCPFLDTVSERRSPHGGFACSIYERRPLACRAYPVIESSPITLDGKCKFCQQYGNADENLAEEIEALAMIKAGMDVGRKTVWRYATGIGEAPDMHRIRRGWVRVIG